jgi:hypothetical protein
LADLLAAMRQGLKQSGYVEGKNLAIEYRFADNQLDRLLSDGSRSGRASGRRDHR